MRTSKFLVLSLLAASLAFGFQSCKKDKDDNPATSTENTTGGNGGSDNNGDKKPASLTFNFSENLNSADKTVENGAELKLEIGNLASGSVVSAYLDGEEIKVENGVIILPTTTAGVHKVKVVVNNEEQEFTFKVLLPALEIKTCALSTEEKDLEVNTELTLNLDANNPCTITVKVNGNVIEAKDGVFVLPTDKAGEFAVSIEFNDGQNEAQTEDLEYKVFNGVLFSVNGVKFKMINVYGGTFLMGAQSTDPESPNYDSEASDYIESPVHEVTLSSYSIGQTEVTQALWNAVMGGLPDEISTWSQFHGDDKPVRFVSWEDVQTFLTELNKITGKTFRLPTEAEWEFAARGGINSKGYKYSGTTDELGEYAWYGSNELHDVGTKKANELGLYDMSGNVSEWCQELIYDYPRNPYTGGYSLGRVSRGGNFSNTANYCRVSQRFNDNPVKRNGLIGFRLAL